MKERRRAGKNIGVVYQRIGAIMKKILRQNIGLSFLLFVLSPMHIAAKDITVSKTLLSYTVTLDAVDEKFLLKGTAQKSRVYFTILPEKYVPTKVSVYVDGVGSDLSITKGGSYYVDLEEGQQLTETKQYAVKLAVDNSESNTVNVTVFDFAGELNPVEYFDGRSQSEYGLKEKVNLSYSILPDGIAPEQIGNLLWKKITVGVGALSAADDGTGVYDAGYLDGTTELCLEIQTGLNSGVFQCYPRTVVAPSGTYMTRADTTVWHVQYTASAGIKLYYWLEPGNVSFSNLKFAEGTCPATNATGIFLAVPPGPHNPTITPVSILGNNSGTANRLDTPDAAYVQMYPWDPGGVYTWNIPTQYVDESGNRYTFGSEMSHIATIQPNGYTTVSKGGNTGSAAVNDVSVPWQIP